ncbi:TetR/AcrR family transcriptional regulator [Rhizobium leucaenae]|uniref:AcrR family transcriptional regulator n=1 Tax=Rhizobium leucaenae TaxID=29450 RepID=A0A7W7EM49_9HYPH|nr:TetR/AcrR family transcriptional regulator [Rhizobium leucaenae]MBB4570706.1 AcrR family transcriptional regulator [Rhizobium leucaenae]MBB6303973.1 AcrR family transcriptional regulator [Rhizobium leucaenae]
MSTRIKRLRSPMRKKPSQARSRATVDAIIEAGARILGDREWAGFTTNIVAAVAGVSIGSLYQYFPDKLSLVEAIRRRHFDEVLAVLRQATASDLPLQQSVEALVQGMIDAHNVNPELHRVLLDEVPGLEGSRSAHDAFVADYQSRYRDFVAAHRGAGAGPSDDVLAQLLSGAVEGVIHNGARKGTLDSPELKQELVKMICSYLSCTDR